ncbi:MAG: DNA repair protein, partial [Chloroflexi bacterium]|nr:DNA repair protein [Chloroflexota bacterium]
MRPDRLYFTGDAEADALLAREPMALLIGFVLDQQVTVQKAFRGPLELRRRLGTLDAGEIAAMDPTIVEKAFR